MNPIASSSDPTVLTEMVNERCSVLNEESSVGQTALFESPKASFKASNEKGSHKSVTSASNSDFATASQIDVSSDLCRTRISAELHAAGQSVY